MISLKSKDLKEIVFAEVFNSDFIIGYKTNAKAN
jgi:hypothetical protein